MSSELTAHLARARFLIRSIKTYPLIKRVAEILITLREMFRAASDTCASRLIISRLTPTLSAIRGGSRVRVSVIEENAILCYRRGERSNRV